MFKTLSRFVSTLSASMLVLGMLTFAPGAFASTTKFSPTPATLFNYGKDATINFQVGMSGNNAKVDVTFKVKGPIGKPEEATKVIANQVYNGNVLLPFSWNGKFDGNFVKSGDYQAIFEGADNVLIHPFKVVSGEPKLAFVQTPADQYLVGSGDYKFSASLSGFVESTKVDVSIVKKNPPVLVKIDNYTYEGNTSHSFVWDGKLNGNNPSAGDYELRLAGEDTNGNMVLLSKNFKVVTSTPTLTFNPTPASDYTIGSGNYKVNVDLSGFANKTRVTVAIVDPNSQLAIPKGEFDYLSNDSHQFNVDMTGYKVGTYEMQVTAKDLVTNVEATPLKRNVNVVNVADDSCAGYKDIKATDKNCDAVEWLKKSEIMTGQGNGDYFDGISPLNRAEVSKISLEAYNQYNANTNYCNGDNPFPDVDDQAWYGDYVCRGVAIKMITGYTAGIYAGLFKPANEVTVVEMMSLLLRPLNKAMPAGCSYTLLDCNAWYSGPALFAKNNGYYPGQALSPTKEASRFEVAQFLYALHLDGKI